jgi:hypothetical protein
MLLVPKNRHWQLIGSQGKRGWCHNRLFCNIRQPNFNKQLLTIALMSPMPELSLASQ